MRARREDVSHRVARNGATFLMATLAALDIGEMSLDDL